MVLDERYNFLNDVKLTELEGKSDDFVIYKGIKFNKNERELLKFIKWKGEKFSNYIKALIEQDMRNTVEGVKNDNTTPIISEEYLENMLKKVLSNVSNIENSNMKSTEEKRVDEKTMKSLGNLMEGQ